MRLCGYAHMSICGYAHRGITPLCVKPHGKNRPGGLIRSQPDPRYEASRIQYIPGRIQYGASRIQNTELACPDTERASPQKCKTQPFLMLNGLFFFPTTKNRSPLFIKAKNSPLVVKPAKVNSLLFADTNDGPAQLSPAPIRRLPNDFLH
jgi:hypothetical protein